MFSRDKIRSILFNFNHFTEIIIIMTIIFSFIIVSYSQAMMGSHEGEKARNFLLEDMDGNPVDLSEFRGSNPLIIVFWKIMDNRAFIDYSLEELLFLKQYYAKYNKERGLNVLAVYVPSNSGNPPASELEEVRKIVEDQDIRFPVLIDRGLKVYKEYGVIALPSTVMVNSSGTIKYLTPGFPQSIKPVFKKQIQTLLRIEENDQNIQLNKRYSTANSNMILKSECSKRIC